jgi:ABC-type phosphate/phosphonate transport system substrate-binding protein
MSEFVAALPMYDWPEVRAEVDAEWAAIRDRLRAAGIEAPNGLTRRNGDLPAVPGGIRDTAGTVVAPDPATLPPDELDLATLWRHPRLLLAQTCWGPLEMTGLAACVTVVGQPDYSDVEGGDGSFYSSAIVMRRSARSSEGPATPSASRIDLPHEGEGRLPLNLLRGGRLAFNGRDSISGYLALQRDLEEVGESLAIFAGTVEAGSHRGSALAVVEGRADVAALDCRSWSLFSRFHPEAEKLSPVGWTSPRKGLPYVCAVALPADVRDKLQGVLGGI